MLGIGVQTLRPLSSYGPLGAEIERLGFSTIAVFNDVFCQPAWLPMLEIARATKHIRIGTGAVNPFTCHPVNIAGHLALLAEAAEGRIYLGMARGAWLESIGVHPTRMLTALPEAFACVRHLLARRTEPLLAEFFPLPSSETLHWNAAGADMPFGLASWGPRMVRACISHISEVKVGGTANPAMVRWMRGVIDEACQAVGRPPVEVELVIGAATAVDADAAAARDLARRELAHYVGVVANLDPTLDSESNILAMLPAIREAIDRSAHAEAAALISDDLLQHFALAGSVEDIVTRVEALLDAGATRIEFAPPYGLTGEDGLKLLGEMVRPAIEGSAKLR